MKPKKAKWSKKKQINLSPCRFEANKKIRSKMKRKRNKKSPYDSLKQTKWKRDRSSLLLFLFEAKKNWSETGGSFCSMKGFGGFLDFISEHWFLGKVEGGNPMKEVGCYMKTGFGFEMFFDKLGCFN
jgi:hypothetical protein